MPSCGVAGHVVEVVFDDRQVQRADVKRCAFGQPAAQQAVGLLVGSPLPGAVGVAEIGPFVFCWDEGGLRVRL